MGIKIEIRKWTINGMDSDTSQNNALPSNKQIMLPAQGVQILYFAEKNNLPHKSGFIHVPLLPEQVAKQYRASPYMPIEMSRKALSLVIGHVEEIHRQNKAFRPAVESG